MKKKKAPKKPKSRKASKTAPKKTFKKKAAKKAGARKVTLGLDAKTGRWIVLGETRSRGATATTNSTGPRARRGGGA